VLRFRLWQMSAAIAVVAILLGAMQIVYKHPRAALATLYVLMLALSIVLAKDVAASVWKRRLVAGPNRSRLIRLPLVGLKFTLALGTFGMIVLIGWIAAAVAAAALGLGTE